MWTPATMTTGAPCSSAGTSGSGGMLHRPISGASVSGARRAASRHARNTDAASSYGYRTSAAATSGPRGWRSNSSEVTTPRPRPPPRTAQNRSVCSSRLAVRTMPSAVTISTERRLSQLRPWVRIITPSPPPRVRPATPVTDTSPPGVASPWTWVARSTSPQVAPACTRAVRAVALTWTARMAERSMTRPSSQTALPATWWPPPRMLVTGRWCRATRTASTTSATSAQRAMTAGWRSISPFQTRRASS